MHGNIKPQITSVFEKNKTTMKRKYPEIAPVFKPAEPRQADIEHNPFKKLDTMDYFSGRKRYQNQQLLSPAKRTAEFMDLLSMSRKLDSSVRIGK